MSRNNFHKIFYVEEDKVINDSVSFQLSTTFDNIQHFYDAESALNEFNKGNIPDILVTDIKLPNIDGIELSKILKRMNSESTIIFTTAYNDISSLQSAIELNVNKYLIKPFKITDLIHTIDENIKKNDEKKLFKFLAQKQKIMTYVENKDDSSIVYMNENLLEYLGFKSIKKFKESKKEMSDYFLKNDKKLYFKELVDYDNWIDKFKYLPIEQKLVSFDIKGYVETFHVNIEDQENLTFVNFYNITETLRQQKYYKDKALKDPLTNIYNREFLNTNFKDIFEEFKELRLNTVIVLIDIDNFKSINDNFGHIVGDRVIKDVVESLKKSSRKSDILIRWGGEEFLYIIPVKEKKSIFDTVEKFRKNLESSKFSMVDNITCSFGVTICEDYHEINEAMKRADIALYDSKRNGKNKVTTKFRGE